MFTLPSFENMLLYLFKPTDFIIITISLQLHLLDVFFLGRNLECLNLLLNTGADFNKKDKFGR